jgi:hypothetical protein
MQRQITIATAERSWNTKEWNAWIKLSSKLKQQILDTADKGCLAKLSNNLMGHAAVTTGELLNHLVAHRCEIKCDDVKANKQKLGTEWSPTVSLKELWIHARECQESLRSPENRATRCIETPVALVWHPAQCQRAL